MRILLDVNHPAHVHMLRPVIEFWLRRGEVCRVAARDKDVAVRLLTAYRLPWEPLGRARGGLLGAVAELVVREVGFLRMARAFRPEVVAGTSAHVARVGRMVGAKSVFMTEDDTAAVKLSRWTCLPFATAIVTPDCLAHERHGSHHFTYPSFQELFYLHPKRFQPDRSVLPELGLSEGKPYGIVRLSALSAYHDVGKRGVSDELLREILRRTKDRMHVFVTSERRLAPEFERLKIAVAPERMHDALAYASFFMGDSQTMTAEAAVLGVPAFRLSDFVGRLSYLEELQRYGLAFGFKPGQERELLECLDVVLGGQNAGFQERRRRLLSEKIDPLPWFVETVDTLVNRTEGARQALQSAG